MIKKIAFIVIISALILLMACSTSNKPDRRGIEIENASSSIGSVEGNNNNHEVQSFKYTITLTNYEKTDITIVSVNPILNEEFNLRVRDIDISVRVNKVIPQGGNLEVSGEIIFDAVGLTKEQILGFEPFIKEFKVLEERTINRSF